MAKTFILNGKQIELFVSGESVSLDGRPTYTVSKVKGSPFVFSVVQSAAVK